MKHLFTLLLFCFWGFNLVGQGITINNIVMTPAPPVVLMPGEYVTVTFDYAKPDGAIRIFARPAFNGALLSQYQASPGDLLTANTGTVTQSFTSAIIDKSNGILFFVVDENGNSLGDYIAPNGYDCYWTFTSIGNVQFDAAAGARLAPMRRVNFTFDYSQTPGHARIFTYVRYAGSDAPNYLSSPSPVYTELSGSGSGYFTLSAPGQVDEIFLQMADAFSGIILYSLSVPVDYSFWDYGVGMVEFNPPTPATLLPGQQVQVSFDFVKPDGVSYIYAVPKYNGNIPASGINYTPSDPHPENSGHIDASFTLRGDGTANSVDFHFEDEYQQTQAVISLPVQYLFTQSSGVDETGIGPRVSVYPSPVADELNINVPNVVGFRYQVLSFTGSVLREGQSQQNTCILSLAGLSGGTYVVRIYTRDSVVNRLIIKE